MAPPGELDVNFMGAIGPHVGGWAGEHAEHDVLIKPVPPADDPKLILPEAEPAFHTNCGAIPYPISLGQVSVKATLIINPGLILIPMIRAGTAVSGRADHPVITRKPVALEARRNDLSAR